MMARVAVLLFCALLALAVATASAETSYVVKATRLSLEPVINSQRGQSAFTFNYNAAYIDLSPRPGHHVDALVVRCQNESNSKLGPSKLTLAAATKPNDLSWTKITNSSIVFQSEEPWENYGTEDPRIVYDDRTKEYYMLYSAVQQVQNGSNTYLICRLSLATAKNPADPKSWVRHGPIFKDDAKGFQWTKSGATLLRESGPNYLIFGDSSLMPGIQVATTRNLLDYELIPGIFIHTREDKFDSALVESGPPPVKLSDGNYLFIYNSAKKYPQSRNGLQYNVGYVILDGKDPLKILARSDVPILSPELPWEIGTAPYLGNVPNVVFCEGMKVDDEKKDEFTIYYGAADSVVGVASVKVTIHN